MSNTVRFSHIISTLIPKKNNWYNVPDNMSAVLVNPITGKPAVDTDPKKKLMYFIKGTEPKDTDQVFDEQIGNATPS